MTNPKAGAERRKQLGIFYTPTELSDVLCKWAIRSSTDLVLEPSFGGCAFLTSAHQTLQEIGSERPERQLYGCDVDPEAFRHLGSRFGVAEERAQFVLADFLKLRPKEDLPHVDAVIGNPPYVSNHRMSDEQRLVARQSAAGQIARTASLWAYFVTHSLEFLNQGGRIGFVLPGYAFSTNYGKDLLTALGPRFDTVAVIHLSDRLFANEGARESTAILLCDGMRAKGAANVVIQCEAEGVAELGRILANRSELRARSAAQATTRLRETVAEFQLAVPLGSIAEIHIGIVTGANRFFVVSPSQAHELCLPKQALTPVLSRMALAPGILLERSDFDDARAADRKCLLLNTNAQTTAPAVRSYLRRWRPADRNGVSTFRKRRIWHRLETGEPPDAFLSYMTADRPRLVVNTIGSQCLNNIHRLYLRQPKEESLLASAALFLLSHPGQAIAEILGRAYGDGVLKLEPSAARELPVLLLSHSQAAGTLATLSQVDGLLRRNKTNEAINAADSWVGEIMGANIYKRVAAEAAACLPALRSRRQATTATPAHRDESA